MELDTHDLQNISIFLQNIQITSKDTGLDIMDKVPLWSDGDILGYLVIDGGHYKFSSD